MGAAPGHWPRPAHGSVSGGQWAGHSRLLVGRVRLVLRSTVERIDQAVGYPLHAGHHSLEERGTVVLPGPGRDVREAVGRRLYPLVGRDDERGRFGYGL